MCEAARVRLSTAVGRGDGARQMRIRKRHTHTHTATQQIVYDWKPLYEDICRANIDENIAHNHSPLFRSHTNIIYDNAIKIIYRRKLQKFTRSTNSTNSNHSLSFDSWHQSYMNTHTHTHHFFLQIFSSNGLIETNSNRSGATIALGHSELSLTHIFTQTHTDWLVILFVIGKSHNGNHRSFIFNRILTNYKSIHSQDSDRIFPNYDFTWTCRPFCVCVCECVCVRECVSNQFEDIYYT